MYKNILSKTGTGSGLLPASSHNLYCTSPHIYQYKLEFQSDRKNYYQNTEEKWWENVEGRNGGSGEGL